MLTRLFISNYALIERLELSAQAGLTVLTGETGAGKSLLTGALKLALGAKTDSDMVRQGAEQAQIEAEFELPNKHPTLAIIAEHELTGDEAAELILRRVVVAEGKSKAFINGLRANQNQLSEVAESLVDLHGQHEQQLLRQQRQQARLLDIFAGAEAEQKAVQQTHRAWRQAAQALADAKQELSDTQQQQDLYQAYVQELSNIDYQAGEEEGLAAERKRLAAAEQIGEALTEATQALEAEGGALTSLNQAERAINSAAEKAGAELTQLGEQLYGQVAEITELTRSLASLSASLQPDPARLAIVDDRLAALRELARKHRCEVSELSHKFAELQRKLNQIEAADDHLAGLAAAAEKARAAFETACGKLAQQRQLGADKLAPAVQQVLAELHMAQTTFETRLVELPPEDWNSQGAERVEFWLQANPGLPIAPLAEAASGGEASRILLALKQVFYAKLPPMTLIFDEIDTGIGGAVAAAVGAALKALSQQHQVFVITHQAQVAAQGDTHWRISKTSTANSTTTSVELLDDTARQSEVARMLAGKEVTAEAEQAAVSLLKGAA